MSNQSIARSIEITFRELSESKGWWYQTPLKNTTEAGDVCLEWWNGDRKLTVYVNSNESATFLKTSAGETTEGKINNLDVLVDIWKWLCNS